MSFIQRQSLPDPQKSSKSSTGIIIAIVIVIIVIVAGILLYLYLRSRAASPTNGGTTNGNGDNGVEGCTSNSECLNQFGSAFPVCRTSTGDCVECLTTNDCGPGETCNNNNCICPTPTQITDLTIDITPNLVPVIGVVNFTDDGNSHTLWISRLPVFSIEDAEASLIGVQNTVPWISDDFSPTVNFVDNEIWYAFITSDNGCQSSIPSNIVPFNFSCSIAVPEPDLAAAPGGGGSVTIIPLQLPLLTQSIRIYASKTSQFYLDEAEGVSNIIPVGNFPAALIATSFTPTLVGFENATIWYFRAEVIGPWTCSVVSPQFIGVVF